jgi:hypothetical protein
MAESFDEFEPYCEAAELSANMPLLEAMDKLFALGIRSDNYQTKIGFTVGMFKTGPTKYHCYIRSSYNLLAYYPYVEPEKFEANKEALNVK